jgi:N-acetylglucosamine-6-phosphate deacetylase
MKATMTSGSIRARHYRTGQIVDAAWANGRFTSIEPAAADGAMTEDWIAPALVDLQVNGYGGVFFSDDRVGERELLTAVRRLRRDGCGRILLTIITDHWPAMMARLARLRAARAASAELHAGIAGWHLEGPFMSNTPGYVGAHPPAKMIDPTVAHLRELRAVTGDDPVLLTMAPERAGVIEAIRAATALGMRVSLGHTNASAEIMRAAVDSGASAFTHLGNGIPQTLDRHDNLLWRVIERPELTAGMIPDGIHVSPLLFRIIHRALGERIYYTTDAMHPAGMPPGRFLFDDVEMVVGEDQVVRKPGASNFYGSASRPLECVFRAAEMLGCPWQEAWQRYSEKPAALMGLGALLASGAQADFCILRKVGAADGTVTTYADGRLCSTLPAQPRLKGALLEATAIA